MNRKADRVLLITADEALRAAAAQHAPNAEALQWIAPSAAAEFTADPQLPRFAQAWLDLDCAAGGVSLPGVRRVYFHSSGTVELKGLAAGLFVRKPCTPAVWRMLWTGAGASRSVRLGPNRPLTDPGLPQWLLSFQDLSLRKLCHKCVTRLPVRLGFEHASLYLHDSERGLFTLAETNHNRPVELAVRIGGENGALMTAVARSGEPLMTLDVKEVRRQRGIAPPTGPARPYEDASCLIAPLISDGALRGVLNLSARRNGAEEFDLAALDRVLSFVARALHHAQVFERAQSDARIDSLTGLYNYRWLHETLEREIGRSDRTGEPLAVIVADLDMLKQVNDAHGHAAGDALLRETARRILTAARQCDSAARTGGDEFVILLTNTDASGAQRVADRLATALREEPVSIGGAILPLSASLGFAQWQRGWHGRELLHVADQAMYERKRQGRGDKPSAGAAPRGRFEPQGSVAINLDALRRRGAK